MKIFTKIVAAFAIASVITGCETNDAGEPSKEHLVGLAGAVTGAVVGSQIGGGSGRTAAIVGGAILGGLVGSEVGRSLDKADLVYHSRTQRQAFEYNRVGTTSSWVNPDTGHSGSVTPTRTYEQNGRYCREYTQKIDVGGKIQSAHGTACRNPDGTWKIVN